MRSFPFTGTPSHRSNTGRSGFALFGRFDPTRSPILRLLLLLFVLRLFPIALPRLVLPQAIGLLVGFRVSIVATTGFGRLSHFHLTRVSLATVRLHVVPPEDLDHVREVRTDLL